MADEDPKCTQCFQPITGDILNYGGKPYHVNHLLCTKCSTVLSASGPIKNLSGQPHCASCWTAVMYGNAKLSGPAHPSPSPKPTLAPPVQSAPAPAPAAAPAPAKAAVSVPVVVKVAPAETAVQHHQAVTQAITAAPVQLKHAEPTHDASAPVIEPTAHVKQDVRPALFAEVAKGAPLKHTEPVHDASKPQIDNTLKVAKSERPNLMAEIKASPITPHSVAAGGGGVVKTFEDAIRAAETSLRMIEATKKSVASNEKNLEDSKANALGCDPLPEAEKKLASSKDLLQAHTETGQKKINAAVISHDNAKLVAPEPLKERYNKLIANARAHGFNTIH